MSYNNKAIIGIHGLASKPPETDLRKNWSKCIIEGLKHHDKTFSGSEEKLSAVIDTVYWANSVPDHVEDDEDYVLRLDDKISDLVNEMKEEADLFHTPKYEAVDHFIKKGKGSVLNTLLRGLTIKDDIVKKKCREIKLYQEDQYIADKIREPLINAVTQAWDEGKEIMILSHSMGSLIAYDVLWQLSRKRRFERYHSKKIRYFVTMGSPLGDEMIQSLLFGNRFKKDDARYYFSNAEAWLNFSALGDVVCHDSTLKDDFQKKMHHLGLLPSSAESYRDYVKLWNPFVSVAGKHNPHKSYGYLVQPKLAKWIAHFLNS